MCEYPEQQERVKEVLYMNEKVFRTMGRTGGGNIAMGVLLLIAGVAMGVMMIVNGAKLLKRRAEITF